MLLPKYPTTAFPANDGRWRISRDCRKITTKNTLDDVSAQVARTNAIILASFIPDIRTKTTKIRRLVQKTSRREVLKMSD